jgi:DnaJ-class molecular chaperone
MNSVNKINPYHILNISQSSSKNEIKKAFRKLALKYHPDKSDDISSHEKFIEIVTAYEMLINDTYEESNNDFYKIICNLLSKNKKLYSYFQSLINSIYENDDYILDINTFRFDKLCDKFIKKFSTLPENLTNPFEISMTTNKDQSDLNIEFTYECDLTDIYLDKYINVEISRNLKSNISLYIPLKYNKTIIYGEGNSSLDYKKNGDIVFNIVVKNNTNYIINNENLLINFYITQIQYDQTQSFQFYHLNNEILQINKYELNIFDMCPYYIFKGMGLPKGFSNTLPIPIFILSDKNHNNNNKLNEKGDLIVVINIIK